MHSIRNLRKQITAAAGIVALAATSLVQAAAPATILIPGEHITPESLTSTADGHVIIGSVGTLSIWRAAPGAARGELWIKPGTNGMAAIFGVLADEKSGSLYACSNSLDTPPASTTAPVSTLYVFDLKSGAPKAKYPLPGTGAFCNDIALDAAGNAYVTDTNNMLVGQLKKGAAAIEVWAGADASFGPKGGVLDGIAVLGDRVFVNALATSKLFAVPVGKDGKAGKTTEVKLERPIDRPDGMRSFGKNTLLVAEGGGPGRLARVTITGNTGKTVTLKEGFPDGPVAVTVVGTTAYVLEGQIAASRAAPTVPPAPARPFKATAVKVGKP